MPQVKEYFHDVDLKANQLFNSRLHNVTTSARISIGSSLGPSSRGYMVYDTDLGFPFFWNGVDWGEASGRQIPKWGEITGDIVDQTDLTTYLSGNYYPLSDNPAGYLTAIPSLDEVLTVGNSAYSDITFYAASNLNMNSGSVTFAYDSLTSTGFLSSLTTGYTDIRNWFLPDASGVIPLTVNNIAPDDFGNITISAGGGTWGSITGTVTDQTDLVDYLGLNYYPLSSNPAGYLTTETDPVFSAWLATPPNISIFNNDSGYLTAATMPSPNLQQVLAVGNIDETNTPIILRNTSFPDTEAYYTCRGFSFWDDAAIEGGAYGGLVRNNVSLERGYFNSAPGPWQRMNLTTNSLKWGEWDYDIGIFYSTTITPILPSQDNDISVPNASGTLAMSVNGTYANSLGEITISIPSIGTGTTNYIPKWNNSANGFINSRLYDGGIGGTIYNTDPPSNQFAYLINGYSGVGSSYGLLIAAGSNNTDTSFAIRNYAGNTNLFKIKGDGEIQIYTVPTTGTTSDYILLRDSSGNVKQIGYPTIPTVGTWGALNYPTWTTGTPFVKMTAAGTFALDTNTYLTSAVTSVGLSMPSAFSVASSPVTGAGTIAVTGVGPTSQLIYGTGALQTIPLGDVVGPSSATDNAVARFDTTTGKIIQNSGVTIDDNSNITANATFNGFTSVVASATPIVLTASSTPVYYVSTGVGPQVIQLPVATTLPKGTIFSFNNNQSGSTISVNNHSGTLVKSVPSGAYLTLELIDNTTATGSWDAHFQTPANAAWSTNTLDWAGSFTNGTWNGNVVAYNRGGTGQSSAFVAGGIIYGSTTSALASTAVGTTGQVLTSNGTSAPTWNNITGITRLITVVSSNTAAGSAANTDYVYLVSGTTTVTLPTAVGNTNRYTIKRSGTGVVSIATTSSQTIDDSASPITITRQYVSIDLISNGTNWEII